jgi:hypothetical protein
MTSGRRSTGVDPVAPAKELRQIATTLRLLVAALETWRVLQELDLKYDAKECCFS